MRLPSPAARITTCSGAVMREPWMESLNSNGARITMPATPASARPHARRLPRRPAPPVQRRTQARMSLGRQGRHYLFIGGIQWLVDWGGMVALSHFGMGLGTANVAGDRTSTMLGKGETPRGDTGGRRRIQINK